MIKVTLMTNMVRKSVIIDENTTLRKALEENEINYATGMTALDGVTLAPGDLDKSFAQHGITETCYLSVVVKADNAATIKVAGNACVIESAYTLEQIQKLEKFRPNALSLMEGEGAHKEEVFRVGTTCGCGGINAFGASFGSATSAGGKAVITMLIPDGVEDSKAWVADKVGVSIIKLNKVEAQYTAALEAIAADEKIIKESITVM